MPRRRSYDREYEFRGLKGSTCTILEHGHEKAVVFTTTAPLLHIKSNKKHYVVFAFMVVRYNYM